MAMTRMELEQLVHMYKVFADTKARIDAEWGPLTGWDTREVLVPVTILNQPEK
jgi:hypothetical protein